MKLRSLLPCVVSVFLLAACASTDGPRSGSTTLKQLMSEADVAAKAGQYDKSLALLKGAGGAFPADKAPWLQMAQMKFDRNHYGDAIQHALEALQRDPDDKLANSILAVSGLRLSSRALADLTRQNNLNGSLRSEAQELAKLLRASLGEEVLVPPPGVASAARRAAAPKRPAPPAAPAKSTLQGSGADPFSGLSK
ncbi:tetratricopeptide repeat protein [Janthinobacterium fluminis]|uniref:Tetratricopeptide repeat protein n=1 Tax=Janthinobacterium fluminis TaxID=2987524 RepID=A0ABT5JTH1_9BURK|nr:hypothetical protein [Janthinobacterium fluminis]MDC8756003.1 hypothetical protein [Janthinobacterium fluminis]